MALKPYSVDAYALERVIYEAQAMTPDQAGRFMRALAGPLAEGQLAGQYALLAIGTCAAVARGTIAPKTAQMAADLAVDLGGIGAEITARYARIDAEAAVDAG